MQDREKYISRKNIILLRIKFILHKQKENVKNSGRVYFKSYILVPYHYYRHTMIEK